MKNHERPSNDDEGKGLKPVVEPANDNGVGPREEIVERFVLQPQGSIDYENDGHEENPSDEPTEQEMPKNSNDPSKSLRLNRDALFLSKDAYRPSSSSPQESQQVDSENNPSQDRESARVVQTVRETEGRLGAFAVVPFSQAYDVEVGDAGSSASGATPNDEEGTNDNSPHEQNSQGDFESDGLNEAVVDASITLDRDTTISGNMSGDVLLQATLVPAVAEAQVIGPYSEEDNERRIATESAARRRQYILFVVSIVVIVVVGSLALGLGLGLSNKKDSSSSIALESPTTLTPTTSPSLQPSVSPSTSMEPSQVPSWAPSNSIPCGLDIVSLDCGLPDDSVIPVNGTTCWNILQATYACIIRPTRFVYTYTGNDCSKNRTDQFAGDFTCEDFNGGPPTEAGSFSWIVVQDGAGKGKSDVYHRAFVEIDGNFVLDIIGRNFAPSLRIDIYTNSDESTKLQSVFFQSSCSSGWLSLGDRFGASTLIAFTESARAEYVASPIFVFNVAVGLKTASIADSVTLSVAELTNSNFGYFERTEPQGIVVSKGQPPGTFSFSLPIDLLEPKLLTGDLVLSSIVSSSDDNPSLMGAECSGQRDFELHVLSTCRILVEQVSCEILINENTTTANLDSLTIDNERCTLFYPEGSDSIVDVAVSFTYMIAYESVETIPEGFESLDYVYFGNVDGSNQEYRDEFLNTPVPKVGTGEPSFVTIPYRPGPFSNSTEMGNFDSQVNMGLRIPTSSDRRPPCTGRSNSRFTTADASMS